MFLAWYEKEADEKENLVFQQRSQKSDASKNHIAHFHRSIELIFAVAGEFKACIGDNIYSVKAGEICFVNSFEPHKYYYNRGNEFYVVVISADYFSEINHLETMSLPTVLQYTEGFDKIKEFIDIAAKNWDNDSYTFKLGFVNMLIGMIQKYYPMTPKSEKQKSDGALVDAVRYINENSRRDIGIEEIASKFGYTPNYFSNIFNKFMGMSFRDYLNWCRMLNYTRLKQKQPDISIVKAAELCGFGSTNSFYRAQKRYGNVSYIPEYFK